MAAFKIKKIFSRSHTKAKTVGRKRITDIKSVVRRLKPKILKKEEGEKKKKKIIELKRSPKNPIIEPASNLYWESKAAFNPSAIYHDGKFRVIYRAIGDSDISVLGYTESTDGVHFDNASKRLAYYSKHRQAVKREIQPKILYSSGGGWGGGCEDPRLTLLEDKVYLIYTLFDGWSSLRLALTSISLEDFINKRFNWKEPVLISPPGEIHKNWVLFPEKINGKYAIMHSFSPKILINYFDSLDELDGTKFIRSNNKRPIDHARGWDSWFRGVGPSPIKTKFGWLLIYHAMDHKNPDRYRMGAIILDAKDPTKVLHRSSEPILEPEAWYENEGYKTGVIYSCGAVIKGKNLYVYYGGADKVSCVATANLEKFLEELVSSGKSKLKNKQLKK